MRYFFEIAYDGTNYHGWQRQDNAITIQEVVEEALTRITRAQTTIMGSGRTDTGVHCRQQFFHADFENKIDAEKLRFKLNSYLPTDISIQSIRPVKPDAHARFDATGRAYIYKITKVKDPFQQGFAYYYSKPLDIITMNEAATLLVGEKDFEAFSRVKTEVNNFVCNITEAKWEQAGESLIFSIKANRFLRGMVRAIVGTLLRVGSGKLTKSDFQKVIESKDRREAGSAAPADGLFLNEVKYPKDIYL